MKEAASISSRTDVPAAIRDDRVIVVLRAGSHDYVHRTVDTLVEEGLTCLEVTFTLPDAASVMAQLVRRHGNEICMGAGTVLTAEQGASAIDAGAAYLVSPTFGGRVLARAQASQVAYIPGAMTPTEIAEAWSAGASAVKVFPAGILGPRFIAAVRQPMPDPLLVPSGGVNPPDIEAWIHAGAWGVSLGESLIGDALNGGSQQSLRSRARDLRARVTAAVSA